jgi:hypothetical protein
MYNGAISTIIRSFTAPTPQAELWQFITDGNGTGSWTLYSAAPDSIVQTAAAADATANSSVYLLGGLTTWRTSPEFDSSDPSYAASGDGIVIYDMLDQSWTNQSMRSFRPSGWSWDAQLHHLTGLADGSLLLAMGGATSGPRRLVSDTIYASYDVVSIYNTITNEWANQTTTGDVPTARRGACSVGIAGDNGTYEVSMAQDLHLWPRSLILSSCRTN